MVKHFERIGAAIRVALLVATASLPPAVGLRAQEAPPRSSRTLFGESLGFSVNKLGLQNTLDLGRAWRLNTSDSPLLRDAHVSFGFTHVLTPSYTRLGPWIEVSPLSVLELRLGAEGSGYFGTFGSLMSFDSYGDPFDDEVRSARKQEARAGIGSRLYASPTLRMKAGPIVARSGADFEWWRSNAAGPLYYEPSRDTLLKVDGDRLVTVSTAVLLPRELGRRGSIAFGVSHNLTYVFDAPANRSQRIGVVVVRQFAGRRFGLNAPRVGGQVSYYLDDPTRKGQITAAVGMSFAR